MRLIPVLVFLIVGGMVGYVFVRNRERERAPGPAVTRDPVQSTCAARAWEKGEFHITALAAYDLRALVIATERYRFDPGARLSPIDIAVGWGPMSDASILSRIHFSQSSRFLWWSPREREFPLSIPELNSHSANVHAIPANDQVWDQLSYLRRGDIIQATGSLVEATGPKGMRWRSSLSRDDTGGGACELFWIDRVRIAP